MLIRSAIVLLLGGAVALSASELRFCLRADPKTFHPLLVEDESSSAVRYLTAGVLIRLNRYTQELEGELATKWKVSENGRRIDFELRRGVRFSDGSPFTCEDVAYTVRQLMDPALHSPAGDAFRSAPGAVAPAGAAAAGVAALPTRPVLGRGSQGEAVVQLQNMLRDLNFAVAIDGDFGPGTEVAVTRFQSENGLVADGIVGQQTWGALDVAKKKTG